MMDRQVKQAMRDALEQNGSPEALRLKDISERLEKLDPMYGGFLRDIRTELMEEAKNPEKAFDQFGSLFAALSILFAEVEQLQKDVVKLTNLIADQ